MKKLYTLLAAAVFAVAATAGIVSPELTINPAATRINETMPSGDDSVESGAVRRASVPEGDWIDRGKAIWYEDLLTVFDKVDKGLSWKTTIEESATTPGYYRIAPYTANSPIAKKIGGAHPEAVFYINATDPEKVYIDGDVNVYYPMSVRLCHVVPENGWHSALYGTLADGEISFPAQSLLDCMYISISPVNLSGRFKIRLPDAPEVSEDTWKPIGTGYYTEDCLSTFWGNINGVRWEVQFEENAAYPGLYRIVNPYNENCPFISMDMVDTETDHYMIVDATDPDAVVVYDSMTGLTVDEQYGEVFISSYAYYRITKLGETFDKQIEMGYVGKLENGTITMPERSLIIGMTQFNDFGLYYANTSGGFKIELPSQCFPQVDHTLEVSAPLCAEDNQITVDFNVGASVSGLEYSIAYIPQGGNRYSEIQSTTDIPINATSMPLAFENPGKYLLRIYALDGSVCVKTYFKYFFIMGNGSDDGDWVTLRDPATYEEGYLYGFFSDISQETLSVQVQKHRTKDGYYRLVEPYAKHSIFGGTESHTSHRHYMYINAIDPEKVYIEPSPLGIKMDDGRQVMAWSRAHCEECSWGYMPLEYVGKKDGNVITMPDEFLVIYSSDENASIIQRAGKGFKVTLPEDIVSGVDEVETIDDTPAEYYNLQGMRVSNPETGRLYIVHQGDRTFKQIAR